MYLFHRSITHQFPQSISFDDKQSITLATNVTGQLMDYNSLHPPQTTCNGAKSKVLRKCNNQPAQLDDNNNNDNHQFLPDDDDESDAAEDDEDFEDNSNEIPVWVRGEQRWISGLCEETTCVQLVEALLRDDGLIEDDDDQHNAPNHSTHRDELLSQYVISEQWRRVEQILDANTKVLSIWTAWGSAQSEVGRRWASMGSIIACC